LEVFSDTLFRWEYPSVRIKVCGGVGDPTQGEKFLLEVIRNSGGGSGRRERYHFKGDFWGRGEWYYL
jgi:hypothetical protein